MPASTSATIPDTALVATQLAKKNVNNSFTTDQSITGALATTAGITATTGAFSAGVMPGTPAGVAGTKHEFMDTAAPVSGTFVTGDWVVNSAPSTSSAYGWRCTTGGTPGTWETLSVARDLSATNAWTGANSYSQSISITALGQGLAIKGGANGKIGVSSLSGTSLTVTNTAVTVNSVIFTTPQSGGSAHTWVSNIVPGTSFDIGTNAVGASTVGWLIIENTP